jgi:hypothetical protein
MGALIPLGLLLLGLLLALSGRLLYRIAERGSTRRYEQLAQGRRQYDLSALLVGGRPVVGAWGCALILFRLVAALGVLVTLVGALVLAMGL